MMTIALVALAALSVFASQKFLRSYWFHRSRYDKDTFVRLFDEAVMCPVDGTVVYVKEVTDGLVRTEKKGTYIAENWVGKQDGVLIGIYMCIYDRHFIASPVAGTVSARHEPTTANIPMMDLWEYVHFYFVGKFVDWFEEKAFRYKLQNEKVIYDYTNGMKLMAIADKFVNKIEIPELGDVQQGQKIGHIRRGSQVDIFIPAELLQRLHVAPHHKMKVGELLCTQKKRHARPSASSSSNPEATPD